MKTIYIRAIYFLFLFSCSREVELANDEDKIAESKISKDSTKDPIKDTTPVYHLMNIIDTTDRIITRSSIGELVNDFSEIKNLNQNLIILKIEWRVETSLSISGEGPHCDLIYWKHGYTPWKITLEDSIPEQDEEYYNHVTISNELFPEVNMNELKQYVRGYCKEGWYHYMKNAKNVSDRPLSIGISKVIFRINFRSIDGKKYYSKIYHIDIPMGC